MYRRTRITHEILCDKGYKAPPKHLHPQLVFPTLLRPDAWANPSLSAKPTLPHFLHVACCLMLQARSLWPRLRQKRHLGRLSGNSSSIRLRAFRCAFRSWIKPPALSTSLRSLRKACCRGSPLRIARQLLQARGGLNPFCSKKRCSEPPWWKLVEQSRHVISMVFRDIGKSNVNL